MSGAEPAGPNHEPRGNEDYRHDCAPSRRGVYQHCKEKHLHRYLAEFDFRYNTRTALGYNDFIRAELAAKGIVGKRLTYRRPYKQSQAEAH